MPKLFDRSGNQNHLDHSTGFEDGKFTVGGADVFDFGKPLISDSAPFDVEFKGKQLSETKGGIHLNGESDHIWTPVKLDDYFVIKCRVFLSSESTGSTIYLFDSRADGSMGAVGFYNGNTGKLHFRTYTGNDIAVDFSKDEWHDLEFRLAVTGHKTIAVDGTPFLVLQSDPLTTSSAPMVIGGRSWGTPVAGTFWTGEIEYFEVEDLTQSKKVIDYKFTDSNANISDVSGEGNDGYFIGRMNWFSDTLLTTGGPRVVAGGSTKFSVFADIKLSSDHDNQLTETVVSEFSVDGNNRSWMLAVIDEKLQAYVSEDGTSGTSKDYSTSTDLPLGEFINVGFVFDEGDLRLYLDGVEQEVVKTLDNPATSCSSVEVPLSIGKREDSVGRPFNGVIREVKVYDKALFIGQAETSTHHWTLDEVESLTAKEVNGGPSLLKDGGDPDPTPTLTNNDATLSSDDGSFWGVGYGNFNTNRYLTGLPGFTDLANLDIEIEIEYTSGEGQFLNISQGGRFLAATFNSARSGSTVDFAVTTGDLPLNDPSEVTISRDNDGLVTGQVYTIRILTDADEVVSAVYVDGDLTTGTVGSSRIDAGADTSHRVGERPSGHFPYTGKIYSYKVKGLGNWRLNETSGTVVADSGKWVSENGLPKVFNRHVSRICFQDELIVSAQDKKLKVNDDTFVEFEDTHVIKLSYDGTNLGVFKDGVLIDTSYGPFRFEGGNFELGAKLESTDDDSHFELEYFKVTNNLETVVHFVTAPWCLTQIEDALVLALASSPTLQEWTEDLDAFSHVKVDEDDPPAGEFYTEQEMAERLPLVIIEPDPDGETIRYEKIASGNTYGVGWGFNLRFLGPLDLTLNENQDRRAFKDRVGKVIEELLDTSQDPNTERTEIMVAAAIEHPRIAHYSEAEEAAQFWSWEWTISNNSQIE